MSRPPLTLDEIDRRFDLQGPAPDVSRMLSGHPQPIKPVKNQVPDAVIAK